MKYFISIILLFLLPSCMDGMHEIAVIKNNSNKNIIVIHGVNQIDDEEVFYGDKFQIKPYTTDKFYDGNSSIGNDSNVYFYIFNADSIIIYINRNSISGISKKCLLKKYIISVESLKHNDTILVN